MKYLFLLISILFLACTALENSSEKVLTNANSIIKSGSDKLFIEKDVPKAEEDDEIDEE